MIVLLLRQMRFGSIVAAQSLSRLFMPILGYFFSFSKKPTSERGGLAAGMAYPTTLALITALWSGPGRTRSIALWSGLGGAIASFGPLIAGFLLQYFSWGSVFLATLLLAVVALVMALLLVPSHVNETTNPVDNLGGILSALLIG